MKPLARSGFLLAALGLLAAPTARPLAAQPPGSPALRSLGAVDTRVVPAAEVQRRLAAATAATAASPALPRRKLAGGAPLEVAVQVPVHYSLATDGTRETAADGGTLWRLRVTSPGALFLSFQLSDLTLPPGATLRFLSVDRSFAAGPYRAADGNPTRRFGSPAIPGDSAVIELATPAAIPYPPSLVVDTVSHGFRDFHGLAAVPQRTGGVATGASAAAPKVGVCEVDVNCPPGQPFQAEKRAVALIFDQGSVCTATLINDVRQDCKSYVLTAHHCLSDDGAAAVSVLYWNYENSTCGGDDAQKDHVSTGARLRATNATSDFTLIELFHSPDPAWNLFYAGFSRAGQPPSHAAVLHHPRGAPTKISITDSPIRDGGDFPDGFGSSHWRVVEYDIGTTEVSSSGSALLNPSHQIIGQLHDGPANCSGGWDEYGKLSLSWTLGLSAWLDPDGTGVVAVNGKESGTCCAGPACRGVGAFCSADADCCTLFCRKKAKVCGAAPDGEP